MSTVDSTFNSLATLWSVDIYSKYINKNANDIEKLNLEEEQLFLVYLQLFLCQ